MADKPFATHSGSTMIPDTCVFGLTYNTQISTSPLNGTIKTVQLPEARWTSRLTYTNLSEEEASSMLAWLASLKGMAGRFTMYDFTHPTTVNGVSAGTISVVSSAGGDHTIDFTSLTGGELEVGDQFKINLVSPYSTESELKVVVGKTDADTYTVEPGFRRPIASYTGASIATATSATCRMMLTSDDQAQRAAQSKLRLGAFTIDCMEQFYNE
jgi:hypothetical protein